MTDFKIPGWLRDAAGAPPAKGGDLPPVTGGWRAILRWLAQRLLRQG